VKKPQTKAAEVRELQSCQVSITIKGASHYSDICHKFLQKSAQFRE